MSVGKIGQVEHGSGKRADGLARRGTLTVIDNRTGERFELPIEDGAVRSSELGRQAGGVALYDPGRECRRNRVRLIERIPHAYDYATQDR